MFHNREHCEVSKKNITQFFKWAKDLNSYYINRRYKMGKKHKKVIYIITHQANAN